MATTVKANCPSCGQVCVPSESFTLIKVADSGWASYRFDCPDCGNMVLRPADDRVVSLLCTSGIELHLTAVPDELASHPADAPPLTLDDLLDLGLELGRQSCLAPLAQPGQTSAA